MAEEQVTPDPAAGAAKPDAAADPPKPDAAKPDDTLGPAGEKALAEERAARKVAEKAAKDAQSELDKVRKANMTDQEKAIAEARAEARKEALGVASDRMLRSEIRAAAGTKLADPADAVAHLRDAGDLDRFLSDDGDVDTKAISSAIDDLVKQKPYLSAQARPGALPGGGAKPSNGQSPDDWLRREYAAKSGKAT